MAAESSPTSWSAAQRERLAALGFELYAVRKSDAAAPATRADDVVAAADASTGVAPLPDAGLRLVVLGASARDGALFESLRIALGLERDAIAGTPLPGLPTLAFGVEAAGDAVLHAPALQELRSASAKRALWPALRRLRRSLQGAAGAAR